MHSISETDVRLRIARDNPWWADPSVKPPEATFPRRVYFSSLKNLALDFGVRRATVMLGARRVGKTVMIRQLIAEAIDLGIDPRGILYVSIDTPIYSGISLEKFLDFMPTNTSHQQKIVIFDEIQYLRQWEVHLKDLVDNYKDIKFIATGSAAAALRLRSQESGAGRFSDFMLPPLTFYEFLTFLGEDSKLIEVDETVAPGKFNYIATDIEALNARFIDYLNFGGYPEAVLNASIRNNPEQFIRNDIIDKVLLKDLPSLYGIQEIPELNKLFAFLAYNAGNEASLENISQESGITKPTIRRYIEYLESAFLIIKVSNVDDNCKTMKRERNFKVYLNNPSMRAALFTPVGSGDSERIGHLTESAIFAQWQHSPMFRNLRYARWRGEGEVDIVFLAGAGQIPYWIGEIKWSDRIKNHRADETRSMEVLLKRHSKIKTSFFTTRSVRQDTMLDGRELAIIPSALYCYTVGRNITTHLTSPLGAEAPEANSVEVS
jgi:uncharacterized protein